MSFDLAELQSRINNYTTVVGSWMKNVGNLYFSATPQNVSVKLLDENGNLVTQTLPNVAEFRKRVWDDVGGALGQLKKNYVVDSVNGDDNNDGSSNAPFRTIKKAIDNAPSAANVFINLRGDIHLIDSTINCLTKRIYFKGGTSSAADAKNKILFKVSVSTTFNYVNNLRNIAGVIFDGCLLDFDLADLDVQKGYASDTDMISYVLDHPVNQTIMLRNSKVIIPDNPNLHLVTTNGVSNTLLNISLYGSNVETLGNSQLVNIINSTLSITNYGSSVTGTKTTIKEIIGGIIFDVDSGNPLNVISNNNLSN